MHQATSERGDFCKRTEFASNVCKFFPLRVDPFSEGSQNKFDKVISAECISIPLYIVLVMIMLVLLYNISCLLYRNY